MKYPDKKLTPGANKAKLDKISKPPKGIEYPAARVTPKRSNTKKKY